jgi:hypothetical protein
MVLIVCGLTNLDAAAATQTESSRKPNDLVVFHGAGRAPQSQGDTIDISGMEAGGVVTVDPHGDGAVSKAGTITPMHTFHLGSINRLIMNPNAVGDRGFNIRLPEYPGR